MKKLSQLKEGDILYEYDLNKRFLNILYVIKPNYYRERVEYTPLIVSDLEEYAIDDEGDGIMIWFPKHYDLDKLILVRYNENMWSIFSTDYNAIEQLVGKNDFDLNVMFDIALDMFDQRELDLREDHVYIKNDF